MKNIFKPKLKLVKGTRFVSFLFIGCSILIAAGILFAANMYYNIDTGEIVMEEIQRMTGVLRATAGVIIGGGPTQDPAAGYGFEVATSTLFSTGDVVLSAENQLLRFMGGHTSNYVGFRAPSGLTSTSTYTWPGAYPAGNYLLRSTATGTLTWVDPGDMGLGTITAVGNVTSGAAFTTGVPGEYLWFGPDSEEAGNRGQLTVDSGLTGTGINWTLPALSGTITLASGGLGTDGGVLFANAGLIATSTNFQWDNTNRRLSLGAAGTNGTIRFYGNTSGYIDLRAATTSDNTTYTWPGTLIADRILTTDSSGNLFWGELGGLGGISGSGVADQVAFFDGTQSIVGDSNFTFSTSTNMLTLGVGLVAPLLQYAGQLEIRTTAGGNILLNPDSNIVQLATSTYIRTQEGYEIGKEGTEVLREMIPILGFDLPVQTATNTYVTISRTINNYPFEAAATGTERIHKLAIRYAAAGTGQSDWQVWQVSGTPGQIDTFSLSGTNETDFSQASGEAAIVEVEIPTDQTWRLDVDPNGDTIRIFQIFLAAYDVIQ